MIFGKNSYFNAISITFCSFLEQFKRTKFLTFENQLKKIKLFSPPFAYSSRLKPSIFLINFVVDLVEVNKSKVYCLLQYI